MTPTHAVALARGAAVASALTMGTLGFFVHHSGAAPILVAVARLGLGLVFLTVFISVIGRVSELRITPSGALIGSGLALGVCVGSYVEAIARLSLADAAFLLYAGPLVAVALARVVLRERMSAVRGALVVAAFGGCVCIVGGELGQGSTAPCGLLVAALAGLAYAALIVANRAIPPQVPPLGRAFYQLLAATLILAPLVPWRTFVVSQAELAWLGAVGLIHGFIALTLMIYAMRRLPAHEYGVLAYVEPLTAALVGWRLLGEPLTRLQLIGGGIILASGVALLWTANGPSPAPE